VREGRRGVGGGAPFSSQGASLSLGKCDDRETHFDKEGKRWGQKGAGLNEGNKG